MIPGQFDYVRPGNLDETLRILTDREGEAKLLSGGYSLIPLIKLRLAQPALLVDLRDVGRSRRDHRDGRLPDHRGPRHAPPDPRGARSSATTYPLLHDVTATIGDPQVRNWGTIGGSVAHADPASDWPAVLIAANATIVCRSQSGERDDRGSRLLRRHVPDRHRADRGADRDPLSGDRPKRGRRVREARAQGRRLRDRRGRRDRLARRRRSHRRRAGIGLTGVADAPFAATDAETILAGNAPSDDLFRAGRRRRRSAEPARSGTSGDRSNTSGRWPRS